MAAAADSADQERAGPGGPVPADLPRHHRPEAADRDGRHEGRPVQVRQARALGHEVALRSRLAVQLAPAGPQGLRRPRRRQTVTSRPREYIHSLFLGSSRFFFFVFAAGEI